MNIEKLRKEIDHIDNEIVRLLAKRFEIAVRTRRLKSNTQDLSREELVLNNAKKNARWLVNQNFTAELFKSIIDESCKIQEKPLLLTGFLGVHGCLAETAALSGAGISQQMTTLPCESYEELFSSLECQILDYISIPFEGVLDSQVEKPLEMLINSDLLICADNSVKNDYCLLTNTQTNYQDVKLVYSHPEILSLAAPLMDRLNLKPMPYHDSSAAALMISENNIAAAAVIAPKECALSFSLSIIKEDCIDSVKPYARFLTVTNNKNHSELTKNGTASFKSFIGYFEINNKTGSLSEVLSVFKDNNINLSKLESLAKHNLDTARFIFEGSFCNLEKIFTEISKITKKAKLLGTTN